MKKQFLLSALAVVLAVGGAVASTNVDDEFYPGGDTGCQQNQINRPCAPAIGVACLDENDHQYYYKINGEGDCLPLTKAL